MGATLSACNSAASWLAAAMHEQRVHRKYDVHKRFYAELKERFGLSAQPAIRVIGKVADAYASLRANLAAGAYGPPGSPRRTKVAATPIAFSTDAAQPFDARCLSWQFPDTVGGREATVSILTTQGRRKGVRVLAAPRDLALLRTRPIGEADLICRDGKWFLYATVDAPQATLTNPVNGFVGVDLGIVNIATTSDGDRLAGARLNRYRNRQQRLRKRLQAKKTSSARRLLKKRRRKERRFAADANHQISKRIVAEAQRTGRGIAVEQLTGIRERVRLRKPQRAHDLSWQVVTSPDQPDTESEVPEQFRIRQAKRERLLAEGREPYPVEVARTHTLAEIRQAYPDLPANTETGQLVGVAGRVMFARNSGKLCFATLQEGDGTQLQVMVSLDRVGQESLDAWKADVDLGDIVYMHGEVISSRRGELSVLADSWQIISKALRPLPVAHKEMSEESRVRQRYVDLIVRPEARTIARQRVAVVRAVRSALERRGFLEVETPMLQTLAGGAAARPFVTHSNVLDADLYLRIAPELFLKRCLVGGFDRVFELNRVFRNEGADSTHSPEFAMLETYQAYGTYDDSAVVTREIIQEVADEAIGTRKLPLPDGTIYDVDGEWATIQMYPSLSEALGEEITPQTPADRLWKIADRLGVEIPRDRGYGHGKLVEELWEHTVGDKLWAPTFVRDFPVETTPLTRSHRSIEGVTEKWDLYVRRIELATGYSELIDPVIQRERFEAQARAAAAGDDEAMALDEDFLAALEYAMPPSTGTGMGIDRLLMALTGLSIRETVLFPIVRRHSN